MEVEDPRGLPHLARVPASQRTVLVLQGGGALGSYQAGAYEALTDGGHHIDWVAGVSIGAVNAALIAGNPPERRAERLREFWETITEPTALWPDWPFEPWRAAARAVSSVSAILLGQPLLPTAFSHPVGAGR